jgi:hypothetical protein
MFLEKLQLHLENTEFTENGAKSYKSSLNSNLDLFGKIAVSRDNLAPIKKLFLKAWEENPSVAAKILFWARDIRGGQGERKVFRHLFSVLAELDPQFTIKLIPLVPEFGRWDDLFVLEGNSNSVVRETVLNTIKEQFFKDLKSQSPSLLGKWMPSINASSKETKRLGRVFAKHLGLSEKNYRKNLTTLRSRIKIVEQKMCGGEWSSIDYSKVPSRASFMYRNAFKVRDGERYNQFLQDVAEGKTKINAGTVYPYEIVNMFLRPEHEPEENLTLELLWKNLPNYIDKPFNGIVVADVSGSMETPDYQPLSVSIALALYISERNPSEVWGNRFITFSEYPLVQEVKGDSLVNKIRNLKMSNWGYNTNLVKVFKTILEFAEQNNCSNEDLPEKVIIVSDMEFDMACESNDQTNFQVIQKMFKDSGYTVPSLVFWNVNSKATFPILNTDTNTCIVSGYSPSTLQTVLKGDFDPVEFMLETLYSERYKMINT